MKIPNSSRCYDESPSSSSSSRKRQEIEDCPAEDPSLLVQQLERLTNEIKKRIASLLSPEDAIALSRTCRTVHADLSLTSLELSVVCPRIRCVIGDDTPKRGPKLPTPFSSTHSVMLACTYRDQGWGNHKGMIYIAGHRHGRAEEDALDPEHISQGRIVARSPVAEHRDTSIRLSFFPREDETYYLWYTVGGGGGHQLHIFDVTQIVMVFDNASRGTRDAFRYLSPLFKPSSPVAIGGGGNRAARTDALFESPSPVAIGGDGDRAVRTDGPTMNTEELFLPLLTATLQFLMMMKDARIVDSSSSMAMVATINNPIVSHLREHGLDATDIEVLHALQSMIPRTQVVASILQENFSAAGIIPLR